VGINKLLLNMCQPVDERNSNINLHARLSRTRELLNEPRFIGVDTEDLIHLASEKMKGITDRCAAIAVLKGVN